MQHCHAGILDAELHDGWPERELHLPGHPEDRHQSANLVLQSLQPLAIVDHQPSPEKNWKPQGEIKPLPGNTNRLSEIPTKVVDHFEPSSGKTHLQTAITSLNLKSVWEKPQVFIPLGLVISLLAGISSWLGISHLLHNRAADIVSSEPPKQIDFKNPTIDTDSDKLAVKIVTIEPVMGQAIIKDGTVEANTPVRYRIAAVNGQNLDIQLISTASENVGSIKSSSSTTISSTVNGSSVSYSDNSEATTSPTQNIGASTSNQVLMTILSPTGTPIDPPASRVVGWKGQIRETGNYTIELRTIAGLKGTDFPYKLSVTQLAASNSKREPQITPPPVEAPQGVVIDRSNPIFGTPERKSPNNSPTPEIQENPPVEPPIKPAPPPRKPKPKPKLKPPINQDSATTKTPTAKSESVSPKSPPLVTPPTKQESTTAPTKPEPKPATSPPDQPKVAPETDSSNRQIDPD